MKYSFRLQKYTNEYQITRRKLKISKCTYMHKSVYSDAADYTTIKIIVDRNTEIHVVLLLP